MLGLVGFKIRIAHQYWAVMFEPRYTWSAWYAAHITQTHTLSRLEEYMRTSAHSLVTQTTFTVGAQTHTHTHTHRDTQEHTHTHRHRHRHRHTHRHTHTRAGREENLSPLSPNGINTCRAGVACAGIKSAYECLCRERGGERDIEGEGGRERERGHFVPPRGS